jgi:hypothetical protein
MRHDPCFDGSRDCSAVLLHIEIVVVDRRPSLAKDRKVADRGFTGRFHSPGSSAVTVGFAVTMPLQLFQEHEQSFRQGLASSY